MSRTAYLYVCDTMADWETGFLTAEINSGRFFKSGMERIPVITVSNSKDSITTMGGIKIKPDLTVSNLILNKEDILILPGADTWLEEYHSLILETAEYCLKNNILLCAICGATLALANKGLFSGYHHTSNDLEYLKFTCPGYSSAELYSDKPAVSDRNLITASGVAALEFAYETIKKLNVFDSRTLEAWYNLHKTQKPEFFYELMQSVPQAK